MNKSVYLFVLLVISTIAVDGRKCPNPPVVQNFNVKAYTGLWYEIASSALQHGVFERNCYCSTAQYEIVNATTVSVVNTCAYGSPTNARVEVIGNAYVTDPSQPAKLAVEFNSSFIPSFAKAPYWVLDVGTTYSYALVWSCENLFSDWDLENAFVLSRNPTIDSYTYSKLLNKLQALTGHNPDDMVQQIQGGNCNYQNPSSEKESSF
jgi:apolipoprotein D and lipocalin family protein